jgi:hypothetical protein
VLGLGLYHCSAANLAKLAKVNNSNLILVDVELTRSRFKYDEIRSNKLAL